jgi:hypothetical protein
MPQISKVERDHDIKHVSRLDDLKPATEKSISMATPHIRGNVFAVLSFVQSVKCPNNRTIDLQ